MIILHFHLLPQFKNELFHYFTSRIVLLTSRILCNLNFLGKTAFMGGIFCLEYPSRRSEKVNSYFANYRFSFRKLQIFILQTTDSHFANYRFSFRKLQIFISQTTDFHFVSFHFVSQTTVSQTLQRFFQSQ